MASKLFTGKGRWMLGTVLCIGCLLVGVLAYFSSASTPLKRTLPDGSTLELLQVTHGKKHELDLRPWKERLISKLAARFPKALAGWAGQGASAPTITSSNDTLTVWVRRSRSSPTNSLFPEVYLLDKDATGSRRYDTSTTQWLGNTQEVTGYLFKTYPRQSKRFLLQFVTWDGTYSRKIALAEFPFPNPRRGGKVNPLQPEPLPSSKRDGDIEFLLTRLQTGVSFRGGGPYRRATNLLDAATLAAFRIRQNGSTLTNWQPAKLFMSDVTGNLSENTSWSNRQSDDEQDILFQWGLWPTEPAWKLRVEFTRTSGFTSNEMVQFPAVPATDLIPESNYQDWKKSNALASVTIAGTQIRVMCLRERTSYGNPRSADKAKKPRPFTLEIITSPEKSDTRLTLLEVTDDTGKKLKQDGSGWGGGEYHYSFEDLGNAKALNVSVAFHQSRYAEFIAKPEPFKDSKTDASSR